ncbi:MAG: DNA alkylation repair protein [Candidatus Kariarchaeaceae archaeon]|jgi:3-methyladenine DNA glycosylase AlkD
MSEEIVDFFVSRLEPLRDNIKSRQMEEYLKGKQTFLGVQTPKRKEFYKEFKKTLGKSLKASITKADLEAVISILWSRKDREYRYVALFLLEYFDIITLDSLPLLRDLIVSGDWWDITDGIARNYVGDLLRSNKEVMTKELKLWIHDKNLWIRRSAILAQLKFKENTDEELLEYCITKAMHEKEFFIQKAIGWILREYSKTNKQYVAEFIEKYKNKLSKLSIREGSKYLK